MNSTFLRVLATLMAMAAIVTAYLGYRISHKPPVNAVKVVVPTYPQAVARNEIPAGHVLLAEDIEIANMQQRDKQAFSDAQSLIGKVPSMAVSKGAPFKTMHFTADHPLGQSLAPHERAVAIKVNEVIGVGGFIKPGDHVDVLLYLRTDRETGEVSSAQVVLPNVRVLAYGALINTKESSQPEESTPAVPTKLGTSNSKPDINSGKDSRSAILAVSDQDVAKLMLADSSGILRLALRGEVMPAAGSMATTGNQLIRLGDLAQSSGSALPTPAKTTTALSQGSTKKNPITPAPKRERIIVHRGEKIEVVNVAR